MSTALGQVLRQSSLLFRRLKMTAIVASTFDLSSYCSSQEFINDDFSVKCLGVARVDVSWMNNKQIVNLYQKVPIPG